MLDKKDLSLYTQIGSGVEGIVYDIGNNNVAKIFNKIDLDKMEKIYELKNLLTTYYFVVLLLKI